jgi:hypothetical protein
MSAVSGRSTISRSAQTGTLSQAPSRVLEHRATLAFDRTQAAEADVAAHRASLENEPHPVELLGVRDEPVADDDEQRAGVGGSDFSRARASSSGTPSTSATATAASTA